MRWPLIVVLLPGAALLLIDGVAFDLGEAQKATDHGKVLPERPVLWSRIFLPTQQLAEPALTGGKEKACQQNMVFTLNCGLRTKDFRLLSTFLCTHQFNFRPESMETLNSLFICGENNITKPASFKMNIGNNKSTLVNDTISHDLGN